MFSCRRTGKASTKTHERDPAWRGQAVHATREGFPWRAEGDSMSLDKLGGDRLVCYVELDRILDSGFGSKETE
jgi:hypothetical protein